MSEINLNIGGKPPIVGASVPPILADSTVMTVLPLLSVPKASLSAGEYEFTVIVKATNIDPVPTTVSRVTLLPLMTKDGDAFENPSAGSNRDSITGSTSLVMIQNLASGTQQGSIVSIKGRFSLLDNGDGTFTTAPEVVGTVFATSKIVSGTLDFALRYAGAGTLGVITFEVLGSKLIRVR